MGAVVVVAVVVVANECRGTEFQNQEHEKLKEPKLADLPSPNNSF